MKKILFSIFLLFQFGLLLGQNNFSFIFLPDTHLQPDSIIVANFDSVVAKINALKPDFVITGGDMIYSALNADEQKAKILYDLMKTKFHKLNSPVYYTIGNHEIVGIYPKSGINSSNALWGKGMYEHNIGRTYKSFIYSNWKFFLLDGIIINEELGKYTEGIDSLQMDWIQNELLSTDKNTPVVIVTHTPLVNPKKILSSIEPPVSINSQKILNLFDNYNLKLVLQGHNHMYMNLLVDNMRIVSGGRTFPKNNTNPNNFGFVLVEVKNNNADVIFIKLK